MVARPDVSPVAVVDFDHHSDEFNLNELAMNAELRQKCPVAWNENYGGFWFLTSYDAVSQTARDGDTFAHKYEPNAEDGIDYQGEMGVPRPEGHPALGIGEIDGPYHLALRHALAPFFSPGTVQNMKPFMEQLAHHFLDQKITDGHMDLVLDYASPVPAILTMKLMGLPYDNWQLYANLFHSVMAIPQDSDEYINAISQVPAMMQEVLEFAAARKTKPEDDVTSFLIQFEFDGQRLTDEQLLNILWNLIAGGVDTTHITDRADPAASGTHPSCADNSSSTPSSTAPPPTIPALLLGQPATEPHGHPRRRNERPNTQTQRPRGHQLVGRQPRRARVRKTGRNHPGPLPQPPPGLRPGPAPLHRAHLARLCPR